MKNLNFIHTKLTHLQLSYSFNPIRLVYSFGFLLNQGKFIHLFNLDWKLIDFGIRFLFIVSRKKLSLSEMKKSTMGKKQQINDILVNEDWQSLQQLLRENPRFLRHLFSYVYHADEKMRWRAVTGLGQAAHVLEDDRIQDLLRRMMWSLNDESGTCCWFIPQAIGEIGYQRPDLIKGFLPGLQYHANDPDDMLRTGVEWALERIAQSGLEMPNLSD